MQNTFDALIDSFLENNVGVAEHFISDSLASRLRENLQLLYKENHLKEASIGNGAAAVKNKLVRSDKIYWLDRQHNDVVENDFFDLLDLFVNRLNSTCYTGITGYEFHYTLYEAGSYYKRHLDQFRNNDSRKYSMIFYLNEGWVQNDGGELCIHHPENREHIAPENGKGVFFKSNEMEHEVLLTNKPRMSITGWLKVN